jgi:hypothetical protein
MGVLRIWINRFTVINLVQPVQHMCAETQAVCAAALAFVVVTAALLLRQTRTGSKHAKRAEAIVKKTHKDN